MTSRTARRAAVAALAISVAPLLSPAAAQGAELRFTDKTHDVVKVDFTDDFDAPPKPDPTTSNADIKSVFIHYRKGRLVVRTNFVALTRSSNTLLEYAGEIRTNEKRSWAFDVMTSPGRYAGHDELFTRTGRRACEIGHMLDYRADFARVSIPLWCLSRPSWVQLSLGAATFTIDQKAIESGKIKPGDLVLHIDDALSDTADFTRWTPRVRRG